MIPGTIRADQVRLTIATDDSACPPWKHDFEAIGTERELREAILSDAQSIEVRFRYTALKNRGSSGIGFYARPDRFVWQVWRVL